MRPSGPNSVHLVLYKVAEETFSFTGADLLQQNYFQHMPDRFHQIIRCLPTTPRNISLQIYIGPVTCETDNSMM